MSENIYNYKIITNGDMTSNITSSVVDMSRTDGYSVYAKWTGSPVGTLKIQASLDGINYIDYPGSATAINGSGDAMYEITTAFYDKVQIVYTFSSGSGTLNVQINGKGDLLA